MNIIRKEIRKILKEIFDKFEMPKDFEIIQSGSDTIYKFIHNDINYAVEIKLVMLVNDIMMPDENIKKILLDTKEKYAINFGILLSNNEISDNVQTNKFDTIKIISYVYAIMDDFINKNNAKIITYYATKQRDLIYNYIYNKHLKNDFFFYSAKASPFYDRFLIKKELIK